MKTKRQIDSHIKYREIIPDSTIDAYYKLIKRRIEKGQNIENPINNLIQINGKLPNIIKELIRDNILNELLK